MKPENSLAGFIGIGKIRHTTAIITESKSSATKAPFKGLREMDSKHRKSEPQTAYDITFNVLVAILTKGEKQNNEDITEAEDNDARVPAKN